jgi:hypothetical protein
MKVAQPDAMEALELHRMKLVDSSGLFQRDWNM